MREPKNVLLVTNSATEIEIAHICQAVDQIKTCNLRIQLNLVHVIPTLPTCYFNIPSMALLAENYYDEAKESLTLIGQQLNIPHHHQWLITGKMRPEVLRLAHKLKAHFILASGAVLQDLHKSFFFKKEANNTPIQNMNRALIALNE